VLPLTQAAWTLSAREAGLIQSAFHLGYLTSLFMVGFINSEEKKDYDTAEKVFRELLQKYPKSELAASAQWMVDHMRTDEVPDFLHADSTASASVKEN